MRTRLSMKGKSLDNNDRARDKKKRHVRAGNVLLTLRRVFALFAHFLKRCSALNNCGIHVIVF